MYCILLHAKYFLFANMLLMISKFHFFSISFFELVNLRLRCKNESDEKMLTTTSLKTKRREEREREMVSSSFLLLRDPLADEENHATGSPEKKSLLESGRLIGAQPARHGSVGSRERRRRRSVGYSIKI